MAVNEKLLHITIFGIMLTVLIRLMMVGEASNTPSNKFFRLYRRFGMRFLTKWTFMMAIVYYACMVLVHVLNLISSNPKSIYKLRRFADALLTIIVIPAGMFITTAFWTIYFIDRELIFPSFLDEVIPNWVNHGIHTLNSILPLVDLFLVKHTFSPWAETIKYSALYFGSYMVCLFGTYFEHGIWLYPIFMKMTFLQSICFCLSGYLLVLIFHFIARFMGTKLGTSVIKLHQKETDYYSNKAT